MDDRETSAFGIAILCAIITNRIDLELLLSDSGTHGSDVMFGQEGTDHMHGNGGDDEMHGGNGNDTMVGDIGNDTLHGDFGNDDIFGRSGNDELYGGFGMDDLNGGGGNDMLHGGNGVDLLDGGGWHRGDAIDTVYFSYNDLVVVWWLRIPGHGSGEYWGWFLAGFCPTMVDGPMAGYSVYTSLGAAE